MMAASEIWDDSLTVRLLLRARIWWRFNLAHWRQFTYVIGSVCASSAHGSKLHVVPSFIRSLYSVACCEPDCARLAFVVSNKSKTWVHELGEGWCWITDKTLIVWLFSLFSVLSNLLVRIGLFFFWFSFFCVLDAQPATNASYQCQGSARPPRCRAFVPVA